MNRHLTCHPARNLAAACGLLLAALAAPSLASTQTSTADASAGSTVVQALPSEAEVRGFVKRYFEGTRSMNAARWASAFAPTAVVHDPVGTPALTSPEAILRQGQGFVTAFREVGLLEGYVSVHGLEAVAHWIGRGTMADGKRVRFEGINHFVFDADGRIQRLTGHWNPAAMVTE